MQGSFAGVTLAKLPHTRLAARFRNGGAYEALLGVRNESWDLRDLSSLAAHYLHDDTLLEIPSPYLTAHGLRSPWLPQFSHRGRAAQPQVRLSWRLALPREHVSRIETSRPAIECNILYCMGSLPPAMSLFMYVFSCN
jgi:hypothetical protein